MMLSFPADLFAEAGSVAGGLDVAEFAEEFEKDSSEEMPVFSAAGEEAAEPEFVAFGLINIDDGEVALAAGGDVEAEAIRK